MDIEENKKMLSGITAEFLSSIDGNFDPRDPELLHTLERLTSELRYWAYDPYLLEKVGTIEGFLPVLFSDRKRREWDTPTTEGEDRIKNDIIGGAVRNIDRFIER